MASPVSVAALLGIFNQLQRRGVKYVYGAKADDNSKNPRSTGRLSTPPDTIDALDCSGFTRYVLYQAASWTIPDGSQNQLDWIQSNGFQSLPAYPDVETDVGKSALYVGFIKPYVNGCGSIGHVWLVYKQGDGFVAATLECDGGGGVESRGWDALELSTEAYAAFNLPIL